MKVPEQEDGDNGEDGENEYDKAWRAANSFHIINKINDVVQKILLLNNLISSLEKKFIPTTEMFIKTTQSPRDPMAPFISKTSSCIQKLKLKLSRCLNQLTSEWHSVWQRQQ